ncbi:major facilitator superfamily transporter [Xylogone sp. PMI_703]|nr:major facilitator superfamily transporter [Xylogone sp. PMI_703]
MVPNGDISEASPKDYQISTSKPENSVESSYQEVNDLEPEKAPRDHEAVISGDNEKHAPLYETISPKELGLLSTAFTIATFMIALDGSILSTAIPRITSDFHQLDDISWYGSAYLLTEMSFQPTFGRIYSSFDARTTYLVSIVIFEVGSILCAAAPNSAALIVGRTISGVGAAGLLCGSLAIFGRSVPLKKRPFGMALVTSMYGVAGVLGPTLGGVITDTPRLTWRFCFWMNLPAGAVTFAIAYWTFKTKPPLHDHLSFLQKLRRLDLLGGLLLTGGLVALFFALQWGGSRYKWSDPEVYANLIIFAVLSISFAILQAVKKEEATIPIRIISQRTVAISCIFNILMSMAYNTHNYYLSIYFQAVLGTNASTSGVRSLAYGITGSIAIIVTGASISSKGYYVPFMWLGTSIFIVGCNLLRILDANSTTAQWIGYQIISGLGLGLTEQIPFIAVQVVLPDEDMPTACALVVFSRCFGGAIGLSVAENIFSQALLPRLTHIQGVDVSTILTVGISELTAAVPDSLLRLVREAFNYAIVTTFIMPIVVAGMSLCLSFGMERIRIQDEEHDP